MTRNGATRLFCFEAQKSTTNQSQKQSSQTPDFARVSCGSGRRVSRAKAYRKRTRSAMRDEVGRAAAVAPVAATALTSRA